jgi:hypothetical protein
MMRKIFFFPLILVLITIISCSKDENDNVKPGVTILSPPENYICEDITKEFYVRLYMTDDRGIQEFSVDIVNENMHRISNEYREEIDYSYDTLTEGEGRAFVIIQKSFVGEKFYIRAKVRDAEQWTTVYRQIYIYTKPKVSHGQIILKQKGIEDMEAVHVKYGVEKETLFSDHVIPSDAEFSIEDQILYISGTDWVDVQAWDMESKSLLWEENNTPDAPKHLEDCMYESEGDVYVTSTDHFLRSYNKNGVSDIYKAFNQSVNLKRVFHHSPYFVLSFKDPGISDGKEYLGFYYDESAEYKAEYIIDGEIIHVEEYGLQKYIIIYNDFETEQALITLLDLNEGLDYRIWSLESGFAKSVCVNENKKELYILTDEAISSFQMSELELRRSLIETSADKILYNSIDGSLILYNEQFVEEWSVYSWEKKSDYEDPEASIRRVVNWIGDE